MQDGQLPKDILYGELAVGKRPAGRPSLRFKDVCERDMKQASIDTSSWEEKASNGSTWNIQVKEGVIAGEKKRGTHQAEKSKPKTEGNSRNYPTTEHICEICSKHCHSRIELLSHRRKH